VSKFADLQEFRGVHFAEILVESGDGESERRGEGVKEELWQNIFW